jgi:hypothetical protein
MRDTAPEQPVPLIKINVHDDIGVGLSDVAQVQLSEEQRTLLKRTLEKVLHALFALEIGVEVAPDGTVRLFLRPRR